MPYFKVLNLSDPGSVIQFGSDDLDKVNRYLNGEDLAVTIPINTETLYTSNKLALSDLSGLYKINIITSNENNNGSLTIPVLNGNQTLVLSESVVELKNKVINLITGGNILTGITDQNIDPAASISWSKISKQVANIGDLQGDVSISSPVAQQLIQYDGTKWVNATVSGISGAGEANTYSNASVGGIGITLTKSGVNLPFKGIAAATNKITVADDATNKNVTIDVNQANLSLASIGGTISTAKIANLAITTALIADANVTLAKLASNSVDSSKIVDGSIVNGDISTSAAIAWSKVSKVGSLISDIGNVALSFPSAGQVLTYNGSSWVNQTPASTSITGVSPVLTKKWGVIMGGRGSSSGSSSYGGSGLMENSVFQNTINAGSDATGAYSELTTTSTSQSYAQIYSKDNTAPFYVGLNPKLWFRFKFPTAGNIRFFCGFVDTTPLATNTYNLLNGHDGFCMRYDTTTDSTIKLIHNNSSTTQIVADTGLTPASGGIVDVYLTYIGGIVYGTIGNSAFTSSTQVSATGTQLGWGIMMGTQTGSIRTCDLYYAYTEQDG